MQETIGHKNKRIARNTLMLYMRTFFTMLVSLYTSRVILEVIGIDNYGIYNVVGGIVGLFSIISGSLVNAISRYLTYTLGTGDIESLKKVFSTSLLIQSCLGLLLIIIFETVGLWFLFNKLNIPDGRMSAAFWVFQLSIAGSVLSLLVIPYNACIVSHERMGVYAYFSVLEVVLKLGLIYCLYIIPIDKLVGYAIMIFLLAGVIQVVNMVYCRKKFEECRLDLHWDKGLIKEMSGFAGWNFLGNAANVINFQGASILMNIFFGVVINAAMGIVAQVDNALKKFVSSFMMAINPQIIKSYAQNDIPYLKSLISMSSRYGFYLFMLFGLPIFIETPQILHIWLKETPEYTALFIRLSMIISCITIIGDSSYNTMMATGHIKKFQVIAASTGLLVIPLSYVFYKYGFPPQVYYLLMIANYALVVIVRLILLRQFLGGILGWFLKEVLNPILLVIICASILPCLMTQVMGESVIRLILIVSLSFFTTIVSIYFLGTKKNEREKLESVLINRFYKLKCKC